MMRPHDIIVLIKIIAMDNDSWYHKDIASALHLSAAEISLSLNRSVHARLIDSNKKIVFKNSLLEFLQYGIRYVYPPEIGRKIQGIPTAHSAPPLSNDISATEHYVWPSLSGTVRGQKFEPLYGNLPEAALQDVKLYQMAALVDALRVGRPRETSLALKYLKSFFGVES